MKEYAENRIALKYYDSNSCSVSETIMTDALTVPKQSRPKEISVKSVLVDESHGELLRSHVDENAFECDSWDLLREILAETLGWTVELHSDNEGSLTAEVLEHYDILFIGAPISSFSEQECDAIVSFVRQGNAVLIANNYESLWKQGLNAPINSLLRRFGLYAKRLVSFRYKQVSSFHPHYISSGISRLAIQEPACLKILDDNIRVVATLPETDEPFLTTINFGNGRIVATGDFAFLGDQYIDQEDNKAIALNIFRWLTHQNLLDFNVVENEAVVKLGESTTISLQVGNPQKGRKIKNVQCFLESERHVRIEQKKVSIPSIHFNNETCVSWVVEPRQLGYHQMKLRVNLPSLANVESLSFEHLTDFICIPDAKLDLVFLLQNMEIQEIKTGTTFTAKGIISWNRDAKEVPLTLEFDYPLCSINVEQLSEGYWQLRAEKPGTYKLKLRIKETGQTLIRLIHVVASAQAKIEALEKNILGELEAKVHYQVSQIWPEVGIDRIKDIPFRLMTPEDFVHEVYPQYTRDRLLDILKAVRTDVERFLPMVDELLRHVAPIYLPKIGCCIPFDPKLASHLAEKYPRRVENLAYNFLGIEGSERYGINWIEGNLVSLLLHEKYGHGFFHTQTTLGRQLLLLQNHGFLRRVDHEILNSPYLHSLHEKYRDAIEVLVHSSLLINEGFATWIELTGLAKLGKPFSEVYYRRKEFLFRDIQLDRLIKTSKYFQKFPPGPGSQYRIVHDYLVDIQKHFDSHISPRCALHLLIKAVDVDFGILEYDGRIQFGLSATELLTNLLECEEGNEVGADQRLRKIWLSLNEQDADVPIILRSAQHYCTDLQFSELVTNIVRGILKW